MSNWNRVFKPIVVLVVICIIVTGALAATNKVTKPIIDEATRVAQEQARKELLPDADNFTKVEGVAVENVSDIYTADNGVGTVITCSAKGYGGTVTVMVAFNPDDTIKQIKVTEAAETKGKPTMILAKTVKGKGVSFMEDDAGWHGKAPNDEQYEQAKAELTAKLKELEG